MINEIQVFDSSRVAQELGTTYHALHMWLSRNPQYRPSRRFSGDDLLWTPEDIERVRAERAKPGRGRRRKAT